MILLSTLVIGPLLAHFYNDYLGWRFQRSLEMIELPQDSKVVASLNRFGHFAGSSHCDWESMILVESKQDTQGFYESSKEQDNLKYPVQKKTVGYVYIFQAIREKLYWIDNGNPLEVKKHGSYYFVDNSQIDFMLDQDEYTAITRLINQTSKNEDSNYFIIKAIDQAFSGISTADFRCY
jgi:hypothetical protein